LQLAAPGEAICHCPVYKPQPRRSSLAAGSPGAAPRSDRGSCPPPPPRTRIMQQLSYEPPCLKL
jgi:hypothetical protein